MVAMFIVGVLFGWLLEALFVKFVLGKSLRIFTRKDTESAGIATDADTDSDAAQQTEALAQCDADKAALSKELLTVKERLAAEQAAHKQTQGTLTDAQTDLQAQKQAVTTASASVPKSTSAPTKKVSKSDGDDLTKLGGIGPKIASSMKAVGIDSFTKIAETEVDALCEELTKNNIPYSKVNVASWAEQAKYANQGDWQGLKSYQEGLKS